MNGVVIHVRRGIGLGMVISANPSVSDLLSIPNKLGIWRFFQGSGHIQRFFFKNSEIGLDSEVILSSPQSAPESEPQILYTYIYMAVHDLIEFR